MSTTLKLSTDEYMQMAQTGAFDRLDRRIELIHGEIRQMSPAGPIHTDVIRLLTEWSVLQLAGSDMTVIVQSNVVIGDSQPEPDLAWITRQNYRHHLPTNDDIHLIIEVAHSSLDFDTGEKANLYAQSGIPEYWVIDVQHQQVLVHTTPTPKGYQQTTTTGATSNLSPTCRPTTTLHLPNLFDI